MTWRRQVEECGESRVEDRGSCRTNEMEGRCESDCGRDEKYPASFGDEERAKLKLNMMMTTDGYDNDMIVKGKDVITMTAIIK